jgi:hypothetical protein
MNNGDLTYRKTNKTKGGLIVINLDWKDVKNHRIDYHFNGYLLKAWITILDDDDNIVNGWEFKFSE